MQKENSLLATIKKVIWKMFFVFELWNNIPDDYSEKELKKLLKILRLDLAKENDMKAFMIFSNKSLRGIIKIRPKTKLELLRVRWFSQKKVDKYGNRILTIINK